MANKTVKITVKPDASVTAEGFGFKGKECEDTMNFLDTLGKTKSKKKKPEYFDGGKPSINVHTTR